MDENLEKLASLIAARNKVAGEIASIIGRPAQIGHIGEFIASRIFNIALEESASNKGSDGHFTEGSFNGKTVNIKFYSKQDGLLDVHPEIHPDTYLVITGPKTPPESSRGSTRPWCIAHVFVFRTGHLLKSLKERGVKIGIATSVRNVLWESAEIYPEQRNLDFEINENQKNLLKLFSPDLI